MTYLAYFFITVTVVLALAVGGCVALFKDERPRSSAPVRKPVWSVPNLEVMNKPLIHDGVVYVQANNDAHNHLYAFDLKTGKPLWMAPFATQEIKVIKGDRLVVSDEKGLLHSLHLKTGESYGPPEEVGIVSAVAEGDVLYTIYKSGPIVASNDAGNMWQASVPMTLLFEPLVAGKNVYIYGVTKNEKGVTLNCGIHAFDRATGALRWQWMTEDFAGPEDTPISALAADDSTVFIRINSKQAEGKYGAVLAFDASTGKRKWASPTNNFQTGAPILLEASTLVIADNIPGDLGGTANRKNPYILRGIDRATGKSLWEKRTAWKYETWTHADGLIFVADRKVHALIGTFNDSSPDSFLTAVDIRTAKELWRSETVELGSFSIPAVADGIVVVGSMPFGSDHMAAAGLFAYPANREGR